MRIIHRSVLTIFLACLPWEPVGATEAELPEKPSTLASGNNISTQIAPFQYVQGERWKAPDPGEIIERTGAAKQVEHLFTAGKYELAGTEGFALISKEKVDEQLQVMIANSLAWTGRTKEAGQLYRVLQTGKYKMEAKLGLANLYRWEGRDHLAHPLYKEVLTSQPTNTDAIEGLALSLRELRPKTSIVLGGSNDSSDVKTRSWLINHRWHDASLANVWEVETTGLTSANLFLNLKRQAATLRYSALETFLKPKVELGSDGKHLLYDLTLEVPNLPIKVSAGRVNWGVLSNNPSSLVAEQTASKFSVSGATDLSIGKIDGRISIYKVSDGNQVVTSNLNFTPTWRPFGANIKPLMGFETRGTTFATTRYWSPATGYGSAFLGLMGEWESRNWNVYVSAQMGTRLFGEAGRSWSTSAGGKYWLTEDWNVSLRFWAMASQRDYLRYKARSAYITVEKLWN
jgi:hypothetical protein